MGDQRADRGSGVAEEQRLREAFVRGDERAFEEVVAMYGPGVTRLARRLLGWRDGDAEDVVQEVFVKAYMGRGKFRGESALWTWLVQITVNACRSMRRRKMARLEFLRRMVGGARENVVGPATGKDEVTERVRAAVRRLPVKEREVVVLYYLEEMAVRRVAEILGISQGAVNVRLHRGRGRLEAGLGPMMEGGL